MIFKGANPLLDLEHYTSTSQQMDEQGETLPEPEHCGTSGMCTNCMLA